MVKIRLRLGKRECKLTVALRLNEWKKGNCPRFPEQCQLLDALIQMKAEALTFMGNY